MYVACEHIYIYSHIYKHTLVYRHTYISVIRVYIYTRDTILHITSCSAVLCSRSVLEMVIAGYLDDELYGMFLNQFRPFFGSFSK